MAGSGNGKGIAVDNKNQHETFMKMLEIQGGLGFGVKKFRVVFVFENEKALNSSSNQAGSLEAKPPLQCKRGTRVADWREQHPCPPVFGCTN